MNAVIKLYFELLNQFKVLGGLEPIPDVTG